MTGPIDHIRIVTKPGAAQRVNAVRPVLRKSEEQPEDTIDITLAAHIGEMPAEISIGLDMVRALARGELPQDAVAALSGFAPFGDLSHAEALCASLEQAGFASIPWHDSLDLIQALRVAANR